MDQPIWFHKSDQYIWMDQPIWFLKSDQYIWVDQPIWFLRSDQYILVDQPIWSHKSDQYIWVDQPIWFHKSDQYIWVDQPIRQHMSAYVVKQITILSMNVIVKADMLLRATWGWPRVYYFSPHSILHSTKICILHRFLMGFVFFNL